MNHINKCKICKKYTMEEICCDEKTIKAKPPKYSPEDKYGIYRRKIKKKELIEKDIL